MSTRVVVLTMSAVFGALMVLWTFIPLMDDDGPGVVVVRVQPAYEVGKPVYPSYAPPSLDEMRREFNLDQPLKGDHKP